MAVRIVATRLVSFGGSALIRFRQPTAQRSKAVGSMNSSRTRSWFAGAVLGHDLQEIAGKRRILVLFRQQPELPSEAAVIGGLEAGREGAKGLPR